MHVLRFLVPSAEPCKPRAHLLGTYRLCLSGPSSGLDSFQTCSALPDLHISAFSEQDIVICLTSETHLRNVCRLL